MPRTRKSKSPNGVIMWEGESLIDGAPIVVIATGLVGKASRNSKTGNMVQTWIMRTDIPPHVAVKTGQDASVCGDCSFRPIHAKARKKRKPCYVKTWQAPRSVYESFQRGIYPRISADQLAITFAGRELRLGSYGNPSAAPYGMWALATLHTTGHAGYIHNWRTADLHWRALVMASVETYEDAIAARKLGYRLFRVNDGNQPKIKGEITCPASKEAGHKTTCFSCKACGGHSSKAKANIVINAH